MIGGKNVDQIVKKSMHDIYIGETEMLGKFWWNEDGSLSDLFSLEITVHSLGGLLNMSCMGHCANRQEQEIETVMKRITHTWREFANRANLSVPVMKIISRHSYMVGRSEKVMWHCSERGVYLLFLALDEQKYSTEKMESNTTQNLSTPRILQVSFLFQFQWSPK